jgi:hypothetical protein
LGFDDGEIGFVIVFGRMALLPVSGFAH